MRKGCLWHWRTTKPLSEYIYSLPDYSIIEFYRIYLPTEKAQITLLKQLYEMCTLIFVHHIRCKHGYILDVYNITGIFIIVQVFNVFLLEHVYIFFFILHKSVEL